MLKKLKEMAENLGIEKRVHFVGYLGGDEKSDAYHAAELLVVPSRQEAMSIVAIEAGMCGIPVLLTDQCGFVQLQEIGGGWIVPVSVEGVAERLQKIFSYPEGIRPTGLKMQQFVSQNFTWDRVVVSYINLFERLTVIKEKEELNAW
jgi:glycosyltransferase involved in cell wall biosynthesis